MNDTFDFESIFNGFNVSLFLLIILLGIWLGASLKNIKAWPGMMNLFGEMMAGLLVGLLIGFVLRSHTYVGIIGLGTITLGVMAVLNADPPKRPHRFVAVLVMIGMALFIYWIEWQDFSYLFDVFIEDFRGGS
ncbi:hypothetical protein HUU05_13500 [candidate division KSB1 bacterium]|nr:hypothetical protein [candidate division KSB1 bacterium]